ncbi:MAG: hypothetical protein JSU68_12575 [Phycisphaerales bacterium]|nr:MAG: hypothetical protein JSU68_12575 [Phycisphaerales bacterium]
MDATQVKVTAGNSYAPTDAEVVEQREAIAWAEIAENCAGRPVRFAAGCEDHRFCRLPFNLVARDRRGRPLVELCNSKSLGASGAVLICRNQILPHQEVQLQLNDELDRPWVRAKVVDSRQTIGGHAVRVEFLTESRTAA